MNVISFSLWGTDEKYRVGALENCRLASIIYPEWKVRVYIDETIDMPFAKKMNDMGADIFLVQKSKGSFYGAYWRFWVNDDPEVDRFIIRDCDSRLNWRERAAVDEWCSSPYSFHIMRDHMHHVYPIQGGMWGGKAGKIKSMQGLIDQWNQYEYYGCDQNFLANIIYPSIKNDSLVHDTYHEKKPFPPHKPIDDGGWFVGQIFDKNGIPQKD